MDDSNIGTAVAAWIADASAAETTYGHISIWDTSGVTSMKGLFENAASFNEDISAWDTSSVTDMFRMFRSASAFNQGIGGWDVSGVKTMQQMFESASGVAFNQDIGGWAVHNVKNMRYMFKGAKSFDQDLGWCAADGVNLEEAFTGTKCESTSCGVKKEAFGTCDEGAIAGYSILIALSCLLFLLAAFLAAYIRFKKKKDETYAAAARRLLTSWKKEDETYAAAARRVLCRRGTKVRAIAPTTSEEAPALPASVASVVDAPAAGIAPNELGTVVSVEEPPASQR